MSNKSISFNAEMLKAILDGRKTQTRRICSDATKLDLTDVFPSVGTGDYKNDFTDDDFHYIFRPEYNSGKIYQVKDSKLKIKITKVRLEKLQDITEQDARKEGLIMLPASCRFVINKGDQYFGGAFHDYAECFAFLWDSIYKEDESKQWEANPWVWVYEFERV